MKRILSLAFVLASLFSLAQKGKQFPAIIGLTLDNKAMTLPVNNGKETIVAMVFSRSAEDDLKRWLNPLYETFMVKATGKGSDMAMNYDVNFFFIPAIGGLKMIVEEFKSTTDKAFWPYVMDTDRTDMKQQQKTLGIQDKSIPYIMVLDKDGKIKEVVSGVYKKEKIGVLEEACD